MKKVLRKILLSMTMIACLCTAVNVHTETVEAKSESVSLVTVNKASTTGKKTPYLRFAGTVNAYIGQKPFYNKVVTTGKVTYKSSKKKVATISSRGQIKIKGLGTTTITCKAKASKAYTAKTFKYKIKVTKARHVVSGTGTPRILIVGDSYAWRKEAKAGGIWGNFIELCRDNGKNPTVEMFYAPGRRLDDVASGKIRNCYENGSVPDEVTFGSFLSKTKRKYDYIVLQYDSSGGIFDVCKMLDKWQPQAKRVLFLPHDRTYFGAASADLWENWYLEHCKELKLSSCIRGTRIIANITKAFYGNNEAKARKDMGRDEKYHLGADGYFALGVTMYKTIYGTAPAISPTYYFFDFQRHVWEEFMGLDYNKAKKIVKLIPDNLPDVYNIQFNDEKDQLLSTKNYWKDGAVTIPAMSNYTDSEGNIHNFKGWTITKGSTAVTNATMAVKDAVYYPVYEVIKKMTSTNTQIEYTGDGNEHGVKVTCAGTVLTKGVDYTVEYTKNDEQGTVTSTVNGLGKYTGTVTATFKITNQQETPLSQAGEEAVEETVEEITEEIQEVTEEVIIDEISEDEPVEEVIE